MHTHPAHVTQPVIRWSTGRIQQGFTLAELMITMAIMAILLSLAIPSFNSTIRDNRILTAGNALVAAVAQTRSEAVKRGSMVSMCPSTNGTSCNGGANWAGGWIIYVEDPTVVTGAAPIVQTVLTVGDSMTKAVTTKTAGAPGTTWIRFSPRGVAEEASTLQIKPDTWVAGKPYQEVVIGIAGRAIMTKKTL